MPDCPLCQTTAGFLHNMGFNIWYDNPMTIAQRKIASYAIGLARKIGDQDTLDQLRLAFYEHLPEDFDDFE